MFDNIDKLYGQVSGATAAGGAPPSPPGGGAPPSEPPMSEPPMAETTKRDNLKILLEKSSLTDEDSYIDLSKAKNYLGEMEDDLDNLLNG